MTENEAIKVLVTQKQCIDKSSSGQCKINCGDCKKNIPIAYQEKSYEVAIEALKEIQQYREIGTIEELKYFKDMKVRLEKYHANISVSSLLECFIETVFENTRHEGFIILTNKEAKDYETYCSIGTVEECREAVEKQKPKAPKDSLKIKPVIDENGSYVDADVTVYLLCPNCGEMIGIDESCDKFCRECGQAIDENLEGMEDERD